MEVRDFRYIHTEIADQRLLYRDGSTNLLSVQGIEKLGKTVVIVSWSKPRTMDTQRKLFFKNHKLLGLGRKIGPKIWGAFSAELSAPILGQCVPCPCFPLIIHYFYKNISFWYQIPKNYRFSHHASVQWSKPRPHLIGLLHFWELRCLAFKSIWMLQARKPICEKALLRL